MDSDSDWDSLTADVQDTDKQSIIEKSQHQKGDISPRPPTYEKVGNSNTRKNINASPIALSPSHKVNISKPSGLQTPPSLSKNSSAKKSQRIAENYRSNRNQGVTVFRDTGDVEDKSEAEIQKRSKREDSFDEVELADRSEYENKKTSQRLYSKPQPADNLPYMNFQVKHDYNQNQIPQQTKNQQHFRAEYVKNTPEPPVGSPRQMSPRDEIDARLMSKKQEQSLVKASKKTPLPVIQNPSFTTQDARFYQSPPKSNQTRKNGGRLANLGRRNHGADIITDEESDNTDKDVSWNNAMDSVKVENKKGMEYQEEEEQRKLIYSERIYYQKTNNNYYTLQLQTDAVLPGIAEKSQAYIRRGWQELFGALQILLDFVLIFIVELFRFIAKQFVKNLLFGILEGLSDFVIKPLLAVFYNGVFQPTFTFLWNVLNGFRNLLQPFLLVSREFLSQVAMVLKSIRLIEINSKRDSVRGIESV